MGATQKIKTKAAPLAVLFLSSALVLSGCQTTGMSGPGNEESNNQATKEGAVGGVIIGALLGAALGGKRGAAIGAAAGGLIGAGIGHTIDQRKAEYASTEDFYDAQIKQTADLNVALKKNVDKLKTEIAANETKIASLIASTKSGENKTKELAALKEDLDSKQEQNKTKIASLEEELKVQEAIHKEAVTADAKDPQAAALGKEVAALKSEIAELNEMVDAMATQSATVGQYL